ncbi:hypothetical protein [Butyrivibrio sp. YAB3001]|uniref:hypothetical protein n=1 Tax=Butyrivibrio sp. YAB3001 TaxID=1520812 RepID=UPI0008F67DB3|nr:hypothetical protein [Butyrivibrio sp. YAB3001]SFC40572.1 hypothetical protein SAMN02910398_02174 [Butyrivibrio sp. YAB3001]
MDLGFLASANSITSKYLSQNISDDLLKPSMGINDVFKKKLGAEFEAAYDSLMGTRAVDSAMRQSYTATHQDDLKEHATRLGYCIDNRIIDMLHLKLTDEMNDKVNMAMDAAINNLT